MVFIVGVVILASIAVLRSCPKNMTLPLVPVKSAKNKTYMPSQTPASTRITLASSRKEECTKSSDQTVVDWKHMHWFPCKLGWKGICIWPLGRRHTTYKVTLNGGTPELGGRGKAIPVARGKVRDWLVYDSETWNAIENNPREKKRYLDYEKIALNEYVVMVETRYRLFNAVESTLRICFQQP